MRKSARVSVLKFWDKFISPQRDQKLTARFYSNNLRRLQWWNSLIVRRATRVKEDARTHAALHTKNFQSCQNLHWVGGERMINLFLRIEFPFEWEHLCVRCFAVYRVSIKYQLQHHYSCPYFIVRAQIWTKQANRLSFYCSCSRSLLVQCQATFHSSSSTLPIHRSPSSAVIFQPVSINFSLSEITLYASTL